MLIERITPYMRIYARHLPNALFTGGVLMIQKGRGIFSKGNASKDDVELGKNKQTCLL